MRIRLAIITWTVFAMYAFADDSKGQTNDSPVLQTVAPLPIDRLADAAREPGTTRILKAAAEGSKFLQLTWQNVGDQLLQVMNIPPDLFRKISAERFGITGEVKSSKAMNLIMTLDFVPRAGPGPQSLDVASEIFPTNDWQPFELQYDRGNSVW